MPKRALQRTHLVHEAPQSPDIRLLRAYPRFDLLRREVVGVREHSRGQTVLRSDLLGETEAAEFDVPAVGFLEVDVGGVDVAVDDAGAVDVVEGLGELVENPPNLVLFDPPALGPDPGHEVLQRAALALLHHDIHREVLLVDLVVQVAQNMHVVHLQQGVHLVHDVLLLLGRDGRKRHLFDDDCALVRLAHAPEDVLALALEHAVPLFHLNDQLF